MNITPATVHDVPELAKFAAQTYRDTFSHVYEDNPEDMEEHLLHSCSEEYFRAELERDDVEVDVIKKDGRIVAYAKYGVMTLQGGKNLELHEGERFVDPSVELHRIYVDASQKGQGLGSALMARVEAYALAQGAKAMYLGVFSENKAAQDFYSEKYGFKKIGEYDYPVGNNGHDDHEHIMERSL